MKGKILKVRLVENLSIDVFPYKSVDMKLRDLADRIFYLMQRTITPSSGSLTKVISIQNGISVHNIFENIYSKLCANYYEHTLLNGDKSQNAHYIKESGKEFFLVSFDHLIEILEMFNIYQHYQKIPHYLKKKIPYETIESLYEDIPNLRILQIHSQNPKIYKQNTVESFEYLKYHLDGKAIPKYISHIFVHNIAKLHGQNVKIWEIIPQNITNPTPVCLIPGFGFNYYSFHYEGNDSLDFHLAKQGSRVFIIDHDPNEPQANLDLYAEYWLRLILDFIKRRTHLPQVIIGAHSLAGTTVIFNNLHDTLNSPNFVRSVKAIILLNTPLNFKAYEHITPLLKKTLEVVSKKYKDKGGVPLSAITRLFNIVPGVPLALTLDSWRQKFNTMLNKTTNKASAKKFNNSKPNNLRKNFLQLSPLTSKPKVLKFLTANALTKLPSSILNQILFLIEEESSLNAIKGIAQTAVPLAEEVDEQGDMYSNLPSLSHHAQIYLNNLYRMSSGVSVLAIYAKEDIIASSEHFFKLWPSLPAHYKLQLKNSSAIDNKSNHQQREIKRFITRFGLSSAIGVEVEQDRHFDSISSQKKIISTFIESVDNFIFSPFELINAELNAYRNLISSLNDPRKKLLLQNDVAKKINAIDPKVFWSQRRQILQILLGLIVEDDFDCKPSDFEDTIEKTGVLKAAVKKIISFEVTPKYVIKSIIDIIEKTDTLSVKSYITLIDLAMGIYDMTIERKYNLSDDFLKDIEAFYLKAIKNKVPEISLHALRAFFRTADDKFIKKGSQIYQQMPFEMQKQGTFIFWSEVNKYIKKHKKDNSQEISDSMKPFLKYLHLIKEKN